MAKGQSRSIHVTGPARRDIAAILKWSLREFGEAAAVQYEALVLQAFQDIQDDPERPGSKDRPELLPGVRTYHLSFSRNRVSGASVKDPRHFLVYRCREDGVIEVGRVLHDARDLQQHLPENYLHH